QLPRLGGIDGLEGLIDSGAVDDVVIALPNSQFGVIEKLIKICNRHAVRTHIIPDYFKFISRKFRISILEDVPLITVRDEPLAEFHWKLIKRVIDIAGSLFVIVFVLSWLLPLVSVIQRFTSPGPVFFIQDRIGQRNRIFRCLKFRSMSVEASKKNEIIAIVKDDPRVTRFGRFLRKTNLDEFPQFINVLLGDMSLVGPRPSAVSYNELYKEYVEELKLRHIVKPGITGWAQVNGLRGDVPDETENRKRIKKRFDYDLWYIENWTLLLDLRIAFMTVWQIIRRNNQGM
ncbi:MAG: exopolysaccharide biosynthesis polyprenyl glycosylphosphotransferase, partial [Syntrophothermus sp.]